MTSEPIQLTETLRVYPAETVVYLDGTVYRIRQIEERVDGRWVPSFDVRKFGGG